MARREIVKRRIGSGGLDVACDASAGVYVDLKDDKKTTYEQGRAHHWRTTIYTYRPDNNDGTSNRRYEAEPLNIQIKNDDGGGGGSVPYRRGVIKSYYVEAGRGQRYMKTRIHFLNTAENTSRSVRVQRVRSGDNYVDVERIISFRVDSQRGFPFRGKRVHRKHEEADINAMTGPCKVES